MSKLQIFPCFTHKAYYALVGALLITSYIFQASILNYYIISNSKTNVANYFWYVNTYNNTFSKLRNHLKYFITGSLGTSYYPVFSFTHPCPPTIILKNRNSLKRKGMMRSNLKK